MLSLFCVASFVKLGIVTHANLLVRICVCFKIVDCVQYDIQLPVRAVLGTDVSMCHDHAV